MELHSKVINDTPRDSATVIIVRDAAAGLEVFLVKRHGLSDVLGGAYVFPGGKLDASDDALDASLHLDQDEAQLHAALGEPDTPAPRAKGLFVAALREAFEECGVLFALNGSPEALQQAAQMLRAGSAFNPLLAALQLRLNARAVLPWSRWITPTMPSISSKRFDTRFFIAAMPPTQLARHDDVETTESVWLPPRLALEHYWSRQIALAPPQIMTLAHLSRHATVASAMDSARAALPRLIQPEPFDLEGERVLCYPGDVRHSVAERAMPGPTRLVYRNQRFEPVDGFAALFSA